jgi:hypothetical protein
LEKFKEKNMSDIREKAADEKFCSSCGEIIKQAAEICPKCGCRVAPAPADASNQDDRSSFGFAFLSFLFPLVGLILFIVWNKTYPRKARSCGTGALIGFIIGIVCSVIFTCLTGAVLTGAAAGILGF